MRIVYLFDRALPATETDSEQMVQTAAALARRGNDVVMLLPETAQPASADEIRSYYRVRGDFRVEYVRNRLSAWSTGRKWVHALSSLSRARQLQPDVLYTRNFPTLFAALGRGQSIAYETYRPWGDQFPMLRPAFRAAMNAPGFIGGVFHSEVARARYAALGAPTDRLRVIHNGYDPALFEPRMSKAEARASLGLPPDDLLVTYTGHVNVTKGLDLVLAMAKRCPEATFLLVGSEGDGPIQQLAKRIANMRVVPWQPFQQTVRYLLASDVLLQPPSALPLRLVGNTVLPMKLFLYLAARRPILAPATEDVREVLTDGINAVLVPPGNVDAATTALRALLSDPNRAAAIADAAARSAEHLTWDARAEKLDTFLRERLTARGRVTGPA